MAKIYPDTNRFLDFYREALDTIDVFDELYNYRDSLVLTEQTIVEFRRNRVHLLNALAGAYKKIVELPTPYFAAILRAVPGFKELSELRREYQGKSKAILDLFRKWASEEESDPIAQKFRAIYEDDAVNVLPLTDEVVNKAFRRKLLGNPPTSTDKYSAGDEIIWEALLDNLKDDLVIVTNDSTFHDNLLFLQQEYTHRTGKQLLLVTKEFSEALKIIGRTPSEKLIEVEAEAAKRSILDTMTPELSATTAAGIVNVFPRPFVMGSPCQMSGQICPACGQGLMCVNRLETGVVCSFCGMHLEPLSPRSVR